MHPVSSHFFPIETWRPDCKTDGQSYFVVTNFKGGYKIHLCKLTPDSRDILPESDQVIDQSHGSEANKLYKINGVYYHFYSEDRSGEGRVMMMERSGNIFCSLNQGRFSDYLIRGAFISAGDKKVSWFFSDAVSLGKDEHTDG